MPGRDLLADANTKGKDLLADAPKEQFAQPKEKSFGEKAFEFVEPTVEALGTAGGAALGTPLGPAGVVGGAGLGYGMSREAMRLAREKLGYAQPQELPERFKQVGKDILVGGSMEAGGRGLIAPTIEKAIGTVSRGAGKLSDVLSGKTSDLKAAKIAKKALGDNLPEARKVLSQAADDLSASQALAKIDPNTGQPILDLPTMQALLASAEKRDPEFFTKLIGRQEAQRINQLRSIAGGQDQTAARAAREELKKALNEKLVPVLKTELSAANIAGKLAPKFEREAERMATAATQKVGDVRRFTAAIDRAKTMARQDLVERGLPVGAARYTYIGELSKKADDVASQAAEGSLRFGEASRFADAAYQSLEAHGLRPLESAPIVNSIAVKLRDPSLAGNRDISVSLNQVAKDIQNWTNNGGVIDAFALDSIRKNSVNSAIQKLYPQLDKNSQKQLAAKVIDNVRPILIDAVEQAGGTGYRQYLQNYALGSQKIAQTKLGAEALKLYQSSPKGFVDLVEGNSPQDVEKIFGPGNYDLAKQMSADAMAKLRTVSEQVQRGQAIEKQATAGLTRAAELVKGERSKFRLPAFLSAKATISNKVLDVLEGQVNERVAARLVEAAKSGKNLEKLLNEMPTIERNELLARLNDPKNFEPLRQVMGGVIAGKTEQRKRNPLKSKAYGGINNIEQPLR